MTPLQLRTAIAKRAGELSKVGMRRYFAENRLLLYQDLSGSHSIPQSKITDQKNMRERLVKDIIAVREEFEKMAALPIGEWIDG